MNNVWVERSGYGRQSLRRGVDAVALRAWGNQTGVPDETTICKFRHFWSTMGLTEAFVSANVNATLNRRGMIVNEGTIVDATIIHAAFFDEEQGSETGP